jgi:hypothetical protein
MGGGVGSAAVKRIAVQLIVMFMRVPAKDTGVHSGNQRYTN